MKLEGEGWEGEKEREGLGGWRLKGEKCFRVLGWGRGRGKGRLEGEWRLERKKVI